MARRGYPADFRRRVVGLVESGRKVSEIAAELGVSQQTIYVGRRQAQSVDATSSVLPQNPGDDADETDETTRAIGVAETGTLGAMEARAVAE